MVVGQCIFIVASLALVVIVNLFLCVLVCVFIYFFFKYFFLYV